MPETSASAALPFRPAADECIRIRGARVHNLQNVDVDIPRDQLVVLTGPSGSGKSSLAFDTIFAEGQRQYIESLSVYARQFLNQVERPEVDLIEGLEPTVSIDQRGGSHNPRSTVATVSEIYDYLRLLMARLGEVFDPETGEPIRQQTPEQILESIMGLPEGTKAILLAPLVRGRKGKHKEAFEQIRKAGLIRVRVDGHVYDLDDAPELAAQKQHTLEAVVDRVVVRPHARARIAESIQLALKHGDGSLIFSHLARGNGRRGEDWDDRLYSTRYASASGEVSFERLEPRNFSFNSPYGACPCCEGLGSRLEFDLDLVLPDRSLSLSRGAIVPWRKSTVAQRRKRQQQLAPFLADKGFAFNTPLNELPPIVLRGLLYGEGEFHGVLVMLTQELATATKDKVREQLESFRGQVTCEACGGSRLRPEATAVKVGGKAIHEMTALPIAAAQGFFESLTFDEEDAPVGERLRTEIVKRLGFLNQVGLGYLSLDRPATTLSGGESQRVRLAAGIGSGLVGVCYVLDEPTIGLHARDNDRLIAAMRELQQMGNSVLVVEHDAAVMEAADWLIDLGPGAGSHGGRIVSQGTLDEVKRDPNSLTGQFLSGKQSTDVHRQRRPANLKQALVLEGVTTNNLRNITASFPLGLFLCVSGVSGSGKSSLIVETLCRALHRKLHGTGAKPGPFAGLKGADRIDKLVEVDQSPIGRTPRSNPATYTGVFDEIRKVFAATRDAKLRGYKLGRFSFNVKGGRCEDCQGQGTKKIEMNFLPDLYVTCPTCNGKRFNRQTLSVRYRGHSIADVLDLRVDAALDLFANFSGIHRVLESLHEVGLGYLTLGQPSTMLSGGEAQRVKLATELARTATGGTFYILDEPTTGLHFDDIRRLLAILHRLVDAGNTVLVIEHNLDVIASADWIIDLGPDGGTHGGEIVATGTPEDIAREEENHTGRYLRSVLSR